MLWTILKFHIFLNFSIFTGKNSQSDTYVPKLKNTLLSKYESVKFHWLLQWKLTDLTVRIFFPLFQSVIINWLNREIYFFTGKSVKRQITDSISVNLTDSDLESSKNWYKKFLRLQIQLYSTSLKFLKFSVIPEWISIVN